jgi:hypothetical protein
MILDVLFFIIIILLILSIETKIIIDYKTDITTKEKDFDLVKKDFLIDLYLLDCNYLGKIDLITKKCNLNEIEIKNLNKINENFCNIKINETEIYSKKESKNSYKRGVIYKNKFSVLEVGFCE